LREERDKQILSVEKDKEREKNKQLRIEETERGLIDC